MSESLAYSRETLVYLFVQLKCKMRLQIVRNWKANMFFMDVRFLNFFNLKTILSHGLCPTYRHADPPPSEVVETLWKVTMQIKIQKNKIKRGQIYMKDLVRIGWIERKTKFPIFIFRVMPKNNVAGNSGIPLSATLLK